MLADISNPFWEFGMSDGGRNASIRGGTAGEHGELTINIGLGDSGDACAADHLWRCAIRRHNTNALRSTSVLINML